MVLLIYLLIIAAGGLVSLGISGYFRAGQINRRLVLSGQAKTGRFSSGFLLQILPFTQVWLRQLKWDVRIKQRLDAAHLRLGAAEFFNLKLLLMFFLASASFLLRMRLEPAIILFVIGLGFFLPEMWLMMRINQRKYAIVRLLPETVDLLSLCVEAGLDFTAAVKWIIEKKLFVNPMIEELGFVVEEVNWGKSRHQALKDMSLRLNIPQISSFTHTLLQAEKMGTPVVEALTVLSEDLRLQRFRQGERLALQGPIKILIPLVFCILPVIAIVVAGPIFLQFLQGNILGGMK